MSLPHLIMWAVVLAIGVPSAWRNPTAGALVLCWVFSEGLFALTGNGLAVEYFIYPDVFVLAIVFVKTARYPCYHYRNAWHQFACILTARSWPDRIIMCSYPLVWACYAAEINAYHKWWMLWWLAIAQYLIAGAEPLADWLRRSKPRLVLPFPSNDLQFAGGRVG